MDIRSPTTRLKIVDFPTFGLPTIATVGFTTKTPSFSFLIYSVKTAHPTEIGIIPRYSWVR
ncbi:hypothetical protein APU01nite_01320 [Alkalibacterium putridalgicola]|uniref:Uncharacterized protein n=1 Tax=Alkalibacterium putridalgicola TaxID=426703 RepID=A0ABQ0UU55_9LACT|nr:hypothetical protein APU01nite_01320 [Alkalibacterium putridalgicola]